MSALAFVLLDNPTTPDMSAVAKALRTRYPELPAEAVTDDTPAGARQANSPLIRCGNEFVAVMSMAAPIPQDPGLWSRTATTWSEGKTIAARHRGHLIVSVLGKGPQPLPAARLSTAVTGALIAVIPECCGVVWGGKVARPARLWLEMSSRSYAPFPDYPFTLWVDAGFCPGCGCRNASSGHSFRGTRRSGGNRYPIWRSEKGGSIFGAGENPIWLQDHAALAW
ncbi:hypothetical protein [Bradyrhizobium sp. CCGUVB23]|uniref:hypothetical protein n=1 Tax=Bradyrhizobium sp. CCGUVB23 TaxID=2949630 RepID=UPI0020B213BF|nr:hypothetical protein [Bradyrhizobium sp. CCGUVB23]MCP3464905.1 hypothetical protein [Bradyrhizobium sp. CCGUVB23]